MQHDDLAAERPCSKGPAGHRAGQAIKIALINVRYSPNLGDGLLAECLERELHRHLPEATFVTVDLAGRAAYGLGSRWRRPLMNILLFAPGPLRRLIVRKALQRTTQRLLPAFTEVVGTCHAAVLGGGNLLADADLNFPMKIAQAARAVEQSGGGGLPLAIYAVGASHNWSAEGAGLFQRVLAVPSLVSIAVRDKLSRDALLAQAPDQLRGRDIALVRDPGLLAARHFPFSSRSAAGPIGICVTAPLALRYHGGTADDRASTEWIGELVRGFASTGRDVLLFTNGSPEDRHYLARNQENWCRADKARIRVAPPAQDPAGLVELIAGCSLVIAHRMHACIAAHSFGIPTIGLRWDPKLDAFFELAGREKYLHTVGTCRVQDVAASARTALAEGVALADQARLTADAVEDVATLARALREVVAR